MCVCIDVYIDVINTNVCLSGSVATYQLVSLLYRWIMVASMKAHPSVITSATPNTMHTHMLNTSRPADLPVL